MRNLALSADQAFLIWEGGSSNDVASLCVNHAESSLHLLLTSGEILNIDTSAELIVTSKCRLFFENVVERWFALDYLVLNNCLVAVSHEGSIATIETSEVGGQLTICDQIGLIDGSIADACWGPAFDVIAIVTYNHSIMLMSNTWEPILEVPFPAFDHSYPVKISWKGDGELLAVLCKDASDGMVRIRVFDRSLEVSAIGHNVGDGPASTVKGIGNALSFAVNGSLIAYHQKHASGVDQVLINIHSSILNIFLNLCSDRLAFWKRMVFVTTTFISKLRCLGLLGRL